jgi:hypothetical protein
MNVKGKSPCPEFQEPMMQEPNRQEGDHSQDASFTQDPKISLDPLYDHSDKYRQVVKPMELEDFLRP